MTKFGLVGKEVAQSLSIRTLLQPNCSRVTENRDMHIIGHILEAIAARHSPARDGRRDLDEQSRISFNYS